ncbi:hypothetical protein Tco_1524261 [Tanacetum coccineum]
MAEPSSHNPSSPEITLKEEPVTLDKLESPNPFLPATQVEFTFEEIAFTTNNEVEYAKLIWEDLIHKLNKKTREKIVPYHRFISLLLEHMMHEYDNEELTINPTQAICKLDVHVVSKAPKPSSQNEEVPQGKNSRAKSGLRRKQSSKHTSESQTEASKSKTGQSKTETKYSSAKDKSPSHPSPPTPVVGELHKEAQQAAGGPTSLGATSKEGTHPQLSSDKTKSARDGLKIAHTNSGTNEESIVDDISKKIKQEDLLEFLKNTRSAFFTPDSPQDDPIIVTDKNEEEEADKEDTHDTSHDMPEDTSFPPSSSPKSAQIQELMDQHVKDMEIELPGDLKEIPTKLETFTSTISSLTSQKQLKTLDSLPSLLNKVTETLNKFSTVVENVLEATTKDVPSAGQATASPAEGEKNTKDAKTNLKDELVDLLGTNVVTPYYNKKLLFDLDLVTSAERKKEVLDHNVKVLRRLGSIFTSVYAAIQKLKKDSWKELQFSLVDNSKLNVVYLLNKS